jgi:hypothetical protein
MLQTNTLKNNWKEKALVEIYIKHQAAYSISNKKLNELMNIITLSLEIIQKLLVLQPHHQKMIIQFADYFQDANFLNVIFNNIIYELKR